MKHLVSLFFLCSLLFSTGVFAQTTSQSKDEVTSAYRKYKDIPTQSIVVPTVIEVPFDGEFLERFDFAVFDQTRTSFEPHYFRQELITNQIPVSVSASANLQNPQRMIDGNSSTFTEFSLPETTQGRTQIVLTSSAPITSTTLSVLLDNHVALPTSIEIRASTNEGNKIIVATRKLNSQTINFPKTTSQRWTITLTYGQPLRIAEFRLIQENITKTSSRALRFLAQPGHAYRVYFDSDRRVVAPVGEAGNLALDSEVLRIAPISSRNNSAYVMADVDKDGVADVQDNCVPVVNANQEDVNGNGRGDACDDFDRDGLINSGDNCPDQPNRDQRDTDGDGIGDVCDPQESRITEQYPWLPWVGIGFAGLVLVVLLVLTVRSAGNKPPQSTV